MKRDIETSLAKVLIIATLLLFSHANAGENLTDALSLGNAEVSIKAVEGGWKVHAEMISHLTPRAFIALLENSPDDCSWMHNCKSVKLLAKPNENTREIQTRFDSPWPFDDRLMQTKSIIRYNEDSTAVSVFISPSALNVDEQSLVNAVLLSKPSGLWEVHEHGEYFLIRYEGTAGADPTIPNFLLKSTLKSTLKKTFTNMHAIGLKQQTGPQ